MSRKASFFVSLLFPYLIMTAFLTMEIGTTGVVVGVLYVVPFAIILLLKNILLRQTERLQNSALAHAAVSFVLMYLVVWTLMKFLNATDSSSVTLGFAGVSALTGFVNGYLGRAQNKYQYLDGKAN